MMGALTINCSSPRYVLICVLRTHGIGSTPCALTSCSQPCLHHSSSKATTTQHNRSAWSHAAAPLVYACETDRLSPEPMSYPLDAVITYERGEQPIICPVGARISETFHFGDRDHVFLEDKHQLKPARYYRIVQPQCRPFAVDTL